MRMFFLTDKVDKLAQAPNRETLLFLRYFLPIVTDFLDILYFAYRGISI